MSYIVPSEIPKYCNKCPFGHCVYNRPDWFDIKSKEFSNIDYKENKPGTYGYVCNLEYEQKGRYETVIRADIYDDMTKPNWCPLIECEV